jgi:hypothetical protein
MVDNNPPIHTNHFWRKPENWISLITMILVAIYTGIQLWQTLLVRRNNVATLQAFVYPSPPTTFPALDDSDNNKKLIGIIVPFLNSGNTPTKNVIMTAKCAPSVEALNNPWPLIRDQTINHASAVIAPHSNGSLLCSFTADQMIQVKKRGLHAYVLAEVTYQDRLDDSVQHRTQAEWELIHPLIDDGATHWNGIQSQNIGLHNCADEECPPD